MAVIYDLQADNRLLTPEGDTVILADEFSKEEFVAIRCKITDEVTGKTITNPDYTNYVAPARQACAAQATRQNSMPLILFVLLLLIVLISMSTFRSPAVALMPDVTVKPLRSKANAIINLMGTAGGILVLVLGIVFSTSAVQNALMSYNVYYGIIAAIMLTALTIFLCTVREPKWAAEMAADSVKYGIEEEQADNGKKRELSASEKRSLLLILASIALWYFGYNAVTSKYAVYAGNILDKDYNTTMLLAQGAAILSYIPSGNIASRFGRKKTILAGVVMLATAFGVAAFMRASSPTWMMNALFILAGVAWATINVNSFPMVVEMCSGGDVGKYTGFYYTASMSAQIATPMLSGFLMDKMGMTVLFPYAAIFVALAFVTMSLVKHGDAKVLAKKGLEALDIDD
jgi:MFS family permease